MRLRSLCLLPVAPAVLALGCSSEVIVGAEASTGGGSSSHASASSSGTRGPASSSSSSAGSGGAGGASASSSGGGATTSTGSTASTTSVTASSSGTSASSSSSASSTSSSSSGNAVTGTAVDTYYGEGAPAEQPEDLAGAQVEALVWTGSSWTTYPGSGSANGAFTIPDVPQGPFMLVVAGSYLYTTARSVDMGYDAGGRSTANYTTSTTDTVGGALQGLDAWQGLDFFQWSAPNASGAAYSFASSGPSLGATQLLAAQSETWQGALIDASAGDVLYGTQLAQQTVAGTAYTSVTRFASFHGVEQTDGTPVDVTGTLAVVPQNESIDVDLRSSQFVALASGINPQGQVSDVYFSVITAPGAGTVGFVSYDINLLYLDGGATDTAPGALAYGNPFPASWGEVSYPSIASFVSFTAKGATSPATLGGSIFSTVPVADVGGAPIVPTVGPVQSPAINGQSAFDPQTGVGTTPVLSWTPPTVGTPSAYHVVAYEVRNAAGSTTLAYLVEIVTTTTTLPMPPGILTSGNEYVFVITAVTAPLDATTKPYRGSPSLASADCLTAIITP